jgi:exopolysaccharide biosynthesis polyprenyl glycosylphosphotransferase
MNKVELRGDRRSTLSPPRRVLESAVGRSAAGGPKTRRVLAATREVTLDILMLGAAVVATVISAELSGSESIGLGWVLAFSGVALVMLVFGGAYQARFTPHLLDDLGTILGATAIAVMSVTFGRVLVDESPDAASEAIRAWVFAFGFLVAGRVAMEVGMSRRRRSGEYAEPALIVGAGNVGQLVARRLMERPEFGLRPVAFLDDEPLEMEHDEMPPVLGTGQSGREIEDREAFRDRLEDVLRRFDVGYVLVTFSLSSHDKELTLVRACQELGVSVSLVPRLFEGIPDQTTLERIGGLPLVSIHPSDPRGWQFAVKYAVDRVVAAMALVVFSPVFAAAALGTLLSVGRPIFFPQRRVGLDGQEFVMVKFRTMRAADEADEPAEEDLERDLAPGGVEGEDRRTRFGALLRRLSLDELPQLLNVVRGEMSLIGPRPERVAYAQYFNTIVRRYADRHRVKSGITGWAQVHGLRGKTSLADRVEWDNYYVENWSLWLDVKIFFRTLVEVGRGHSE